MNIAKLMKQAQKVQGDVARVQAEVALIEKTFSVGGGAVQATARGDNTVTKIKIDPAAVNPNDAEALEDMIVSAVNGALAEVKKEADAKLSAVTAGLNIPGLT